MADGAAAKRYMRDDLHVRGILVAGLLIVASIAVAIIVAFGMVHLGNEGAPPPRIAARAARVVDAPAIEGPVTLQMNPGQDIRAFDAEKRQLIGSYGWADRAQGLARIPVERAMALMATEAKDAKR